MKQKIINAPPSLLVSIDAFGEASRASADGGRGRGRGMQGSGDPGEEATPNARCVSAHGVSAPSLEWKNFLQKMLLNLKRGSLLGRQPPMSLCRRILSDRRSRCSSELKYRPWPQRACRLPACMTHKAVLLLC